MITLPHLEHFILKKWKQNDQGSESGQSAPIESIFEILYKSLETESWTLDALENWIAFLRKTNNSLKAIQFIKALAKTNNPIPWYGFIESLYDLQIEINETLSKAILEGAKEQKLLEQLSLSPRFSLTNPQISQVEKDRLGKKIKKRKQWFKDIETLIDEALLLESQGLTTKAQEKVVNLLKMAPQDNSVLELQREIRRKLVIETLHRDHSKDRPKLNTPPLHYNFSEEERNILADWHLQMNTIIDNNPELLEDFTIANIFLENFDAASSLAKSSKTPHHRWLFAESLMRSERGAELMEIVDSIEDSLTPEDFDQKKLSHYYRAHAFKILNRPNEAIEILENILKLDPDFRNSESLLHMWKDELK